MRVSGRAVFIQVLPGCTKQSWNIADLESIKVRVIGRAIAQCDVHRIAIKVDVAIADIRSQADIRIAVHKLSKPGRHQIAALIRGHGDAQFPIDDIQITIHVLPGLIQHVQRLPTLGNVPFTGTGEKVWC